MENYEFLIVEQEYDEYYLEKEPIQTEKHYASCEQ